jgi:anti-anti-sigma factor
MARVEDEGAAATVEEVADDGGPLVRLTGELDISNVDAVSAQLEPILVGSHERVVFDLSSLAYMDSAGLSMLVRVAQTTPTVQVRNASPIIQQIIEATGLTTVLQVES